MSAPTKMSSKTANEPQTRPPHAVQDNPRPSSTKKTQLGSARSPLAHLTSASTKVPAGPTEVQHAENYDDAPPGVPGPDYSARDTLRGQAKPVFTRGPSVLDFSAVTSAGPTPAGEFPNPFSSHFAGARRRETHLPDDDDLFDKGQVGEKMRRQTVTESDTGLPRRVTDDEVHGLDAFAPRTSRQEAEPGVQDETSGWSGTSDTLGGHT